MEIEMIWKRVPDFSRYEVSENGDVRKALDAPSRGHIKPGQLLHCRINSEGYLKVELRYDHAHNNKSLRRSTKAFGVHVLVALAFCGPRPSDKHFALHMDDVKTNNKQANIYWGTKKQNAIDRSLNGNGGNKLTAWDVYWIKQLYFADRRSQRELAEIWGIAQQSICDVVRGRTYQWAERVIQKETLTVR